MGPMTSRSLEQAEHVGRLVVCHGKVCVWGVEGACVAASVL